MAQEPHLQRSRQTPAFEALPVPELAPAFEAVLDRVALDMMPETPT